MYKFKIIFLFFLFSQLSYSQKITKISGFVLDSASHEPIISATVSIEGTKSGTLTNQSGWFSLDITVENNIKISIVGYTTKTIKGKDILKSKNPINILLTEKPIISKEVVIESESRKEKNLQLMGYQQLSAQQIKYTPSLGGESDIMKTLQLLPGVSSVSETSTRINVRGGESNQNLVLIDGVQAYNPMHLMDFVSSFNTDAISNVELLRGSISSEYYGKLSSVLKINLKEGNRNETKWGGGISLLSSQLYAVGPMDANSSYMLSLRRTYFDLILKMLGEDFGYTFNDFYGKVIYHFSQSDHLYLSGYWGMDDASDSEDKNNSNKWGNHVLHLRYNRIWNNSVFTDFSLCYSKYYADLNWSIFKKSPYIVDYCFKNNTDINISNKLTLKTGGDFHLYNFKITSEAFDWSNNLNYLINSYEGNIFIDSKYRSDDKLIANIGAVFSYFKENKTKEAYYDFEPRFNFSYLISDDFSVKFAYTRMHQFIHILSPYNYSLPNDIFYPSSKNLPIMKGNQTTIGVSRTVDLGESEYDFSADLYYNDIKDVPNIKNHYQNADPFALSDQILIGKGWSYGTELQITKAEGRLSGWLNYTWSYAKRLFIGKNEDKAYDAKFNRTHQ